MALILKSFQYFSAPDFIGVDCGDKLDKLSWMFDNTQSEQKGSLRGAFLA